MKSKRAPLVVKSSEKGEETQPKTRTALVVSDDRALIGELSRALRSIHVRVRIATTPGNALSRARSSHGELLVFDARRLREKDHAEIAQALPAGRAVREPELLRIGRLTLDSGARIASINRRQVQLTATECGLLMELMRRSGRTVTREELLDSLGGHGRVFDRTIDRHICNLRRKLGAGTKGAPLIATVHGAGYRLNPKA